MPNPAMSKHTSVIAMLLALTGCASKPMPVSVECPRYVPSPEALKPIQGTGWKTLAERVIETYSSP